MFQLLNVPFPVLQSSHPTGRCQQFILIFFNSGMDRAAGQEHTQKPARDMHRDTTRKATKMEGRTRRATDALMI